jgi:hypothetical protein
MTESKTQENARSRYVEFEKLVEDVFRANNFKVQPNCEIKDQGSRREVDLLLTWNDDVTTVVEVKLYRGRFRHLPNAEQAIAQVLSAQAAFKADHAMIVTNLYRERIAPTAMLHADVKLIGIDDLLALAVEPELRERISRMDDELSSALREFDTIGLSSPTTPLDPSILKMATSVSGSVPKSVLKVSTRGADLKQELFEINSKPPAAAV